MSCRLSIQQENPPQGVLCSGGTVCRDTWVTEGTVGAMGSQLMPAPPMAWAEPLKIMSVLCIDFRQKFYPNTLKAETAVRSC